jgi:hypothetical protein
MILREAEALARNRAPGRRLKNLPRIRAELAKAYTMISHDEALPIPAEQRKFYAELGLQTLSD